MTSIHSDQQQLAKVIVLRVSFAQEDSIMGKFNFAEGSGGIHNAVERSPEHIAERKRRSTLRREERRQLKSKKPPTKSGA